jgi:hypothetical protein
MAEPRIVLTAPSWLYDAAKSAAECDCLSLSAYVRQAVREKIQRDHECLLQPPLPGAEE